MGVPEGQQGGAAPKTRSGPRLELREANGFWQADMRAMGFGRHRVGAVAEIDQIEALHLAYEMLGRMRREAMAQAAQTTFPAVQGAPALVAQLVDCCAAEKRWKTPGGEDWWQKYARLVRAELGGYKVSDFEPPAGEERLLAYVRSLEKRGAGGRTVRNRLSVAGQVFKFAVKKHWLAAAPAKPEMPRLPRPQFRWINEDMFRSLRAAALEGAPRRRGQVEPTAIYVARRRVYLSWLYYTGCHTYDADHVTADDLFLDAGRFLRRNHKSAKAIEEIRLDMPEQLHADLLELQAILGRPFYSEEKFAGGPWPHVARVMRDVSKRLGFPFEVNPRILRRSCARELLLCGHTVEAVAERLGHVDTAMVRMVYARLPELDSVKTRWKMKARPAGAPQPTGLARILKFDGGGGAE